LALNLRGECEAYSSATWLGCIARLAHGSVRMDNFNIFSPKSVSEYQFRPFEYVVLTPSTGNLDRPQFGTQFNTFQE